MSKFTVLTLPVDQADDWTLVQDLRFFNLIRAFKYLEFVPRGKRTAEAFSVASAIGFHHSRFYALWRLYRLRGTEAILRRRRSDFGVSRVYDDRMLKAIAAVAPHTRKGAMRRAWRKLGSPGSDQSFYRWMRRLKAAS